ncbi:trifunctional serine/threonine-protein kinase/ATP-binding protein/sensor histidine kinase [Myxococcus stipitatus]|uniref:ATP-binding sensor histidine kinase n=1 Tax=Myxococcus stipitatus TaxID=83455 RepID=UPI001F210FFD|nr:ATP-binding sensor histidine kinase [Myxococcus stipitatus]MCE9672649.1 trifunctional serine/threonine-protein kinase/ATP-binding protein/sensor histidine kinase [Myxococcus stipitatus]
MWELPGYQDVRRIYRGHRFDVFRAWTDSGSARVLKLVREGPLADSSAAMLRHEHDMLRDLRDVPGIERTVALEDLAGLPALVLEDAGPCDLQEWLRRGPLEVDVFLELAVDLASSLGALHRRRVIHRDLSPANLAVTPGGRRLVMIDFDLATRVPGATQESGVPGGFEGTLRYIAPEQTGRLHRLVDHRADLYALGASFYEMLTGEAPFMSTDAAELVHTLLAQPPVPLVDKNPRLPGILSDLVLRLLAKVPEERYQSAEALAEDLREVQRRWRGPGTSPIVFELGRHDLARELGLPERLYGRDEELALLDEALVRVEEGAREWLVLAGASGGGKTALAESLRRRMRGRGRFLSGKCPELEGQMPYAALREAVRGLVESLLEQPPEEVDAWRRRVQEALGVQGRVLTDVLPELERLVGEQPPVAVLGPKEAGTRFHLVFQSFLRDLATPQAPLVLFLDDLQWADAATLDLLERLASDSELHHLMLLGAFRSTGWGAGHPLARLLSSKTGAPSRRIELGPLGPEAIASLCADALRCGVERARPLAALVRDKTAGNPFAVDHFLRHLHRAGLLAYDLEAGAWRWDLERIAQAEVTDNVVELMLEAIRELPAGTQRLLEVAACLRGPVDLRLLSRVVDRDVEETAGGLWRALRAGLLVPEGRSPRFAPASGDAAAQAPSTRQAAYRFAHDRVRQAAYSLLSDAERARWHRRIGLRLWEDASGAEAERRVCEVVDHFHLGGDWMEDAEGRGWLADLNIRAGRKVRDASAFGSALVYFTRAMTLLPEDAWRTRPELMLRLHQEAAECAQLSGDATLAERLIDTSMAHAVTPLEKADLFVLRMNAAILDRDHVAAMAHAREGLRLFGMALPEGDATAAFHAELAQVELNRRGRTEVELLAAPAMEAGTELGCMRLLMNAGVAAWFSDPPMFSFIYTRMLNLTLAHGNSLYSAFAYVCFGLVYGESKGDYAQGHPFSHLGVELVRRLGNPREECRVLAAFLFYLRHWREPLRSSMPLLRRGIAAGLESGEPQYVAYLLASASFTRLRLGTELDRVHAEVESALAFDRKSGQHAMADMQLALRQAVRCLQGRTRERASYDDASFDTRSFLAAASADPTILGQFQLLRLQTSFLVGDLAGARDTLRASEGYLRFVQPLFNVTEHAFFAALTLGACADEVTGAERAALVAQVDAALRRFEHWARNCPENFRHRQRMLAAEVARLEGRLGDAAELFDEAIDRAREEGFPQDEALANLLAGRLYGAQGRKRVATLYLRAAREGFARWGAKAVVAALQEEFPDLQAQEPGMWERAVTPTGDDFRGASLDLLSILKAAQTLSGEVALERLLEKLMAVCLEVAGAQRGALVLEEQRRLVLEAVGAVGEPVSRVHLPLAGSEHVPESLIGHAYRTGDAVVLGDAVHQGRFVSDAYVVRQRVKSALVVPIRRHGRTMGVLYLENNLATHAFTPDRVRVLQLLSSQMAISLENSLLFEERRRAEEAVRFLAESSALLAESLDYEATLARLARLCVSYLCTVCTIDVVDASGAIRRLATAHADPAMERVSQELQESYSPDWSSTVPAVTVLRTREPMLLPELGDRLLEALCRDARHVELMRSLRASTLMVVPLLARGRTLGVISLVSSEPGRHYGPADLELARELARRAAISLDNARLYREAQEAIRLRDEFLSIAAHELYTPITALQLSVQGLARSEAPTRDALLRTSRVTQAQTRRLAHLVDELLDVSRIQTGRLHLSLERVDLAQVVRDVVEGMSDAIARSGCALELELAEGCAGTWDRVRLEQVVTNLLSNALKFGAGRPIVVRAEAVEAQVRLSVLDRGIGIPEERLPHIFGRFERAVSSREYGGLGLGLFIVREIVGALGGRVRAESTLGAGSRFVVELPCQGPAVLQGLVEATGA